MSTIDIDVLIKQVTANLNWDEEIARKAIGLLLAFVKKTCTKNNYDFNQILQKLQGAETLIARSNEPLPYQNKNVGGSVTVVGIIISLITWILHTAAIMDIVKRILTMFFGDKAVQMIDSAGDGTELMGKLNNIGVTREQGTKVVNMFVSFLKQHLDPRTIDELIENIPALKAVIAGTSKKDE